MTPGGPRAFQKVDNATQWIVQLGFPNTRTYPQVSDLIVGYSQEPGGNRVRSSLPYILEKVLWKSQAT